SAEIFQTFCAMGAENNLKIADILAAQQLALNKALHEEIQIAQTALNADPRTGTRDLQSQYQTVLSELTRLAEIEIDPVTRESRRSELQTELSQLEDKLAERIGL